MRNLGEIPGVLDLVPSFPAGGYMWSDEDVENERCGCEIDEVPRKNDGSALARSCPLVF